jgi:hypothetical protein
MAQTGKGNATKVFGNALSVPMNIVIGVADLLRMMLEATLTRYQKGPPPGSGH